MIIATVDCRPFALPLRAPTPRGDSAARRGVLIGLTDGEGHTGLGEIAPLPGWHRESRAEVEQLLPAIERDLRQHDLESLTCVAPALSESSPDPTPSVVFGAEMAWLGLQAHRLGSVPARVLCPEPAAAVALSELFAGDLEEAQQFSPSRSVVKVKVGQHSLDQDRATLAHLCERHETTRWRLDGNRAFTLTQARELLSDLDQARIEYFEEPLRDPTDLPALHEATGVSLALDETLREPTHEDLWVAPGVTAWVCKPALHGGFVATQALARRALDARVSLVVSSCFESGLGLWALAQLAACVQTPGVAAGLGTDRWIAEDLIDPPFGAGADRVAVDDWVGEVVA